MNLMKQVSAVLVLSLASGEGIVRLKDGTFLFGEVVAHDEAGIQVRRLDTGGLIRLKWGHLFPAEENALRTRLGYKDQSGEEVRVEADRLKLDDGTERVGIIFDRTANDFFLRVKNTTVAIPKGRVVAPADKVEVNALDVYTKDQLRDIKIAEIVPQDAQGYLELGRYLVRIHDIRGALESYRKAQTLDSAFHPEEVSATISRLEVQAARQEEVDWIDSIDSARGRKDFPKALELCQVFAQKWPQSTFLSEVNGKKQRIEEERAETLRRKVVLGYYTYSEKLAGKAGGTRDMTQAEAQSYAEGTLAKDVLAKVSEEAKRLQADITPEQVRAIWQKRGKLASAHRSVYGDGTFILGAEKAQKGLTKEKEEKKKDEPSSEEKEIAEKVKKYIEKYQKEQKRLAGEATEEEAPEAWWRGARSSERQQWILSYYAEYGGDMELIRPFAEACQTCGGAGVLTVFETATGSGGGSQSGGSRSSGGQSSQGGTSQVACPTCHKVQIRRGVYYK